MTSAAIYARVSSARQKKDQTIGSQTAALREHARQLGVELPEEWVFEDEGHSGATLVRPALEALRDLAAQGCIDVVLVYSPDRLARKFAYQALLIEEFARAGVRVEFVRGPRGDTPEDQLMVQFQGMFAEYEKAQLMERYRRGKAHRARTGSVNVLSGAPFGYRYVRKTDHAGAAYEIIGHEAALVAEMFRRYADDGASIADLARWLTGQGAPTRTGKHRWDRSVIWAMLRNPAYAGTAVFGKTMATSGTPGLNRVARLQGRSVPRAVKTVDRPRKEWLEIPVPAIVDEDTFARVAQRLADNKRFAARNTKVPSLLQGLAACSACGYGYYRTSARTTSRKIYYYRCLGSDDYRYEGGRVCGNKPVRADYLDTVVWDHITGLLADPALIRAEISKRLDAARTSNPVTRQRNRLELEAAKAATSIAAMIEAFSEQLLTIDELRAKMPHLRARQANLQGQIDALDAQTADRDAYLTLAGDLAGFLTQLRDKAGTATVEERQQVLRLLVKDVLVGPEKITIRHRIPARAGSSGARQHDPGPDTEGDHRPGYPLRWGRDISVATEYRIAGNGKGGGSEVRLSRLRGIRVPDRHCLRGRLCGAMPQPRAGGSGPGEARRVAQGEGLVPQQGEDPDRPDKRRLRFPLLQHAPLPDQPGQQGPHQAQPRCDEEDPAETRRRTARNARFPGGRGVLVLNPVIRGQANYYRTGASKKAFQALDSYLWRQLYKWALRRHPRKGRRWVTARYFGPYCPHRRNRWVFGNRETGAYLHQYAWTTIVRHAPVPGRHSPYDPALARYWADRRRKQKPPQLAPSWQTALRDQRGLCPLCGELLLLTDRAPDSPGQWETWFAAVRKAMTRQAITDNSTGRTKHRLVHAYCASHHPDGGPHGTDQQAAGA